MQALQLCLYARPSLLQFARGFMGIELNCHVFMHDIVYCTMFFMLLCVAMVQMIKIFYLTIDNKRCMASSLMFSCHLSDSIIRTFQYFRMVQIDLVIWHLICNALFSHNRQSRIKLKSTHLCIISLTKKFHFFLRQVSCSRNTLLINSF